MAKYSELLRNRFENAIANGRNFFWKGRFWSRASELPSTAQIESELGVLKDADAEEVLSSIGPVENRVTKNETTIQQLLAANTELAQRLLAAELRTSLLEQRLSADEVRILALESELKTKTKIKKG